MKPVLTRPTRTSPAPAVPFVRRITHRMPGRKESPGSHANHACSFTAPSAKNGNPDRSGWNAPEADSAFTVPEASHSASASRYSAFASANRASARGSVSLPSGRRASMVPADSMMRSTMDRWPFTSSASSWRYAARRDRSSSRTRL
jgi:hypothetical protein